ncbi:MAG: hypothetical protein Q9175_003944 [Cornicularia normoerica]
MANNDGDWKPSGRPTWYDCYANALEPLLRAASMIARNFSTDLNDAFAMDSKLDGLVQKEAVNSQTQELQALEARLRDTEERLKERQSRDLSSARRHNGTNSFDRRQSPGNTFSGEENDRLESSTTGLQATQAPTSQSVSASTMSQWRPT